MAGLGSYEGTGDYSAVHAQKRANAFLMAQSVSANPIDKRSPNKFVWMIPLALGAAKVAGAALAKTAVGAAVAKTVAGVGAKLAATKVGGAVVKGISAISKGVKAVKGFTRKIGGKIVGKKAVVGPKVPTGTEIKVPGAGKGPQFGSGASESQISTISKPKGFTRPTTTVKGTGTGPVTPTGAPTAPTSSTVSTPSSKGGFNVKAEIKKKATEFARSIPSRIKGSMDKSAAESESEAQQLSASASEQIANIPTMGDTPSYVQEEDLTSISSGGSSFAYNAKLRSGPFRMRGWSPFTKKNSPLAGTIKNAGAYLQSITDKNKEQMVLQAGGSGFGIDPVTFQKTKQ